MSAALFAILYLLSAAVGLVAALVLWPRRLAPGGTPLALMLIAAAFWAICDAIELYVPSADGHRLVSQFQYIGVVATAPLFFHAALALSGRGTRLGAALLSAVWVVPLASLVAAWTNSWHRWLWVDIRMPTGDLPFATYEYGPFFWILTAQHYTLMMAATVVLLRAIPRAARHFRFSMATLLAAAILPWIGNAAYIFKMGPWPGLNWLTLAVGVSGALLVRVVLDGGLLDLLPSAREALIERMTDSVIVMDRRGSVMFANQSARDTLPLDGDALARLVGFQCLNELPERWRSEAELDVGGQRQWFDVCIDPLRDRWGTVAGRLLVARDVTLQKMFEDEREHLIDELQDALQEVMHLERLLPMCASCHKVRDDHGYWAHVEEYLAHRAPVEFTHGICPECAERLYTSIGNA